MSDTVFLQIVCVPTIPYSWMHKTTFLSVSISEWVELEKSLLLVFLRVPTFTMLWTKWVRLENISFQSQMQLLVAILSTLIIASSVNAESNGIIGFYGELVWGLVFKTIYSSDDWFSFLCSGCKDIIGSLDSNVVANKPFKKVSTTICILAHFSSIESHIFSVFSWNWWKPLNWY